MSAAEPDRRAVLARLLPSPFVSSFVGRSRDGDLFDQDQERRAAAWAHWAVASLDEFRGLSDREYVALRLPGQFHDPLGTGPKITPHLEVPRRVLERADEEFPERVAQAGNGLLFPWWLVSEVTAVKRALFNTPRGSVSPLLKSVNERRAGLVASLEGLGVDAAGRWDVVEGLLVTAPQTLSRAATADFETADLAEFFPAAEKLGLHCLFDGQLREANGKWAARRIGVWQLRGEVNGTPFALGVVTPRLTPSSLFRDGLFFPRTESPVATLVRLAVMRRVSREFLDVAVPGVIARDSAAQPSGSFLRAVPARVGAKLPEASVEAAVHFLQTYPDGSSAWAALQRWSQAGFLLTVAQENFLTAHASALRLVRRAETPSRDDINVVLPLAWDSNSRVVRVTFSRGTPE
jgi:hypothetical protein